MKKQIFLATTAREDFWDFSKKIIFLGKWCLRYSKKDIWQPLNGSVLDDPLVDNGGLEGARKVVVKTYDKLSSIMTETLNVLHGVDYDERYWKIVVGPWLLFYISTLYDRYLCVRVAVNKYPKLCTILLDEQSFYVSEDTYDFVCQTREDEYNLQLFTKIFTVLGKKFVTKKIEKTKNDVDGHNFKVNFKYFIKDVYNFLVGRSFGRDALIFVSPYFSIKVCLKFFLKSRGKIITMLPQIFKWPVVNLDVGSRKQIENLVKYAENEFERVLFEMIPFEIPKVFVENYSFVTSFSNRYFPSYPKALLTANAWYFNAAFKFWAAEQSERKTQLIGIQYGGGYGMSAYMELEDFELSILDKYFSWGWSGQNKAKIIPAFINKTQGVKLLGADNNKKGILWSCGATPRFRNSFLDISCGFSNYLNWRILCYKNLSASVIEDTIVRLHIADWGWDFKRMFADMMPDVKVEQEGNCSFYDSLKRCRLYVCDHFTTTYLEALALNKPTILFWDPCKICCRVGVDNDFDELRKVGILYDTPESAANAVNEVYEDVESWWNDLKLQKARKTFCDKHARMTSCFIDSWMNEFQKLLKL
jgi:putative transferase (TIGR04331 family)